MGKLIRNIALSIGMISFIYSTCLTQSSGLWSLDQCIDYATSNNLDIKTSVLSLSQSDLSRKQSNYSYLPNLNAGATHGYNWGQSIDPFTNQFASDRVRSNSMFVTSDVTIFSGLKNYYTSQKLNAEYQVQIHSKEILQRDIKINISGLFLQTLMDLKAIEIAQRQLSHSNNQVKRIQTLVKQKHKTKYDLLEVQSQLGLDSLALIKAQNQYHLSRLRLKQSLNLKPETNFEIDTAIETANNLSSISSINYSQLDENLLVDEQQKIQTHNINIAKSGRYPSLSLSGSLGSGYSGNNKELVGSEFLPKPFNIQAKENFYQTATLSLNIPVFNRNQVNSAVQLAQIELKKTQIQKEKKLLEIEYKIEQLKIEIDNANSQISATKKVVTSLTQNFNRASLQYEEGLINYSQFLEIKNKLNKSEIELLQASFLYAFKLKILSYYNS